MGTVDEFDPKKEVNLIDLLLFTNHFGKEKFIGKTEFGELYKGKIPQGWRGNEDEKDVTVKVWSTNNHFLFQDPSYTLERVKDEIRFLGLSFLDNHRIAPKVMYYSFDKRKLGVVYDVKPWNTLYNVMSRRGRFQWRDRIKVALEVARFLKLCHVNKPQYLIRNLFAAHILVDKDFNPVLVDFSMILGGDMGENPFRHPLSSASDVDYTLHILAKTDVYALGVILLEMLMSTNSDTFKRPVRTANYSASLPKHARALYWEKLCSAQAISKTQVKKASLGATLLKLMKKIACKGLCSFCSSESTIRVFPLSQECSEYKRGLYEARCYESMKCLLVCDAFQRHPDFDADDGTELALLALSCINIKFKRERPDMEEVVCRLEKLNLVQKYAGMP